MKAFRREQEELNFLIMTTLATLSYSQSVGARYIHREVYKTHSQYSKWDVICRLRALRSRDIVKKEYFEEDVLVQTYKGSSWWSLTDRGWEAYKNKDWAIWESNKDG